ncbi:general transcription factor 3C polypeptide 1 isoform X2 [Sipha flava]|uniref:General transcription factor 3C polypeptide 1 isoform X2 n=1 Tax=Sipha flava TaxID=143950 RepID=A0A8B8G499_9HEMI|nr:general transcription factor 3C polypeptide 1 isoform X2 [Sipha flava]
MQQFQKDFSSIILDEIALEGLDGITIEALCKRLLNNFDWPLKPIDDSVKKIIWSFVVCLKDVEFYRLKTPRDPLIIFNRYDYIHSEFGSLYEPKNIPKDIYPNHPVEDGLIMGSCKDYFTRFNLGSFPRKISVEEAEKRWGRCLVIVAKQEVRTKILIPEDKRTNTYISIRYYLILERIGRSRYLGEGSFGTNSLRTVFPDSKVLSYIRNRLCDYGLIKNQALAFAGGSNQVANRIVISSLEKFFVKRQTTIDVIVSKIVDYLKTQPNSLASYDQIKAVCNIKLSKTFKQPQVKKCCDTNVILKYRDLYPNATESEYLYKKEPRKEKLIRCIKLKDLVDKDNSEKEHEKKIVVEGPSGREFKQDCSYERQILRWIEKHGVKGVTLSEISRAFRFTTDGSAEGVLKKLTSLNYLTKSYCDRGRTKVFSYIANSCNNVHDNDIEMEDLSTLKKENVDIEKDFIAENNLLTNSTLNAIENISIENSNKPAQSNLDYENHDSSQILETSENVESINQTLNKTLINIPPQKENNKQCDIEHAVTRVMELEYCKSVYENARQSISLTDRFYFRRNIIFKMFLTENLISLLNIKKTIIETEKKNPKFIGTLDIKTLVKIIGYFEKKKKLKSVQYRVTYETKTVNYSFVGTPSVDFKIFIFCLANPDTISYMNSFLNRFNNSMKATKANKKWNLVVQKSPEPKINISELKLPRFMKMRSLHEYLYYLVYDHPGDSLLNACDETEAMVSRYRSDISNGENAQLPKVYYPSVSWKMFVPPLPKYPKYPDGWFFVSDIIHHMPLELMLKIVNFNKSKVNLDKLVNYATHPVFKYLPLMTLSSEVLSMLSQGLKKHIRNTLNVLRLLCTIGLIQFGEKTNKDTELIFAYLNRRASLFNTVRSNPGYYRISDMEYEQRFYEFFSNYELETFWLDTWYFCTNTPLGYRMSNVSNKPKRREIIERSKISIEEACVSRDVLEAVNRDDGKIPGDNKGAAGFDSHLFAHLARNWSIKKNSSSISHARRKTKLNLLLMQRVKKHNSRKKNEKKKTEVTKNQYKMRFKWTPVEDQLLLFWKLGTMVIKQVKSQAYLSYGIKDIIRSILGKYYRSKSIDNYLRRIRYLMRFSSIESHVNTLYDELKVDNEIENIFKSDIEKQHELYNAKKYKAMRDLIVINIKQFMMILRERGITIDTQCVKNKKKNTTILQPIDIKQEFDTVCSSSMFMSDELDVDLNYTDTIGNQQDYVPETNYIFTVNEIFTSVVSSLIHSSLSNQSNDPRISLSYLQAFKQYPDDILKQSFNAIKDGNIITCSQYHKESLQILLSTSHIIQSKTYDYGSKFFSTLVGNTDVGRYKDAYIAYSGIKEDLFRCKMLLLYPSSGLCSTLTSLSLMNIVDVSLEFDQKYLEYMPNENLDEESKCLKNTLKRMRSRHFDLLSTSNDSVEYIKIITSVTKQLKNYQVICKLKQPLQKIEEEIDFVSKRLFSRPTFEPVLETIDGLNVLCKRILEFCSTKEQFGASQRDINRHFEDLSLGVLASSLRYLIDKNLILRAGVEVPAYVHYRYADLWLVKIPSVNSSKCYNSAIIEDENKLLSELSEDTESMGPPFKRMREERPKTNVTTETMDRIKIFPWTRLDLKINKECLEKYLNSVLSKIIVKPGIYLKTLKKDYYPIIHPIHVRELVEMLEVMKCIKMIYIKNIRKPSFFSEPSPLSHKLMFSDVKGLEDESFIMLEPTIDCEIRFGYFSSKFSCYEK